MKLHLPKALLTAVMALFAVSQTAWAGWGAGYNDYTDGYVYYVNDASDINAVTGAADYTKLYIQKGDLTAAEVGQFSVKAGDTVVFSANTWTSSAGNLTGLTIGTLDIADSGTASVDVRASQVVAIKDIIGTISNLSVGGNLTIGKADDTSSTYTLQTVDVTSGGKLILNGGVTTMGNGAQSVKAAGEIVVNTGAKLKFAATDNAHWSQKTNISILGGEWDTNGTRQNFAGGSVIKLSNGQITDANGTFGDGYGAVDIISGSIESSGTSSIAGGVRLRNDNTDITVSDGTLTIDRIVNHWTMTGGITKKGAGTLIIQSTDKGKAYSNNNAQIEYFGGNTVLEAGTVEYAADSDTSYAGTISGTGNIAKSGTGTVTLANINGLDGDISVSGGTLNITSLTATKTLDVSVSGGSLNITAVAADVSNWTPTSSDIKYYVYEGDNAVESITGNGFYCNGSTYLLFNGYEWTGSVDGYTVSLQDGNTYLTAPGTITGDYYINTGTETVSAATNADVYKVQGGTMNISGTINSSDIEYTSGAITLADADATLVLDGSDNSGALMALVTGEAGTIKVTGNTSMSGAAQVKGKLAVEGATLTVDMSSNSGNNKTENSFLTSFSAIELNNAVVKYHGSTTTWNDVTVGEDGATIKIKDMDSGGNTPSPNKFLTLDGTTTLDGALTIESSWDGAQTWKYGVNIALLTGTGDLTMKGTQSSGSNNEYNYVTAKLDDEYTGSITVQHGTGSLTKLTLSADGDINLKGLTLTGGNKAQVDLSGVQGTKNLGTVSVGEGSTLNLQGVIGSMTATGEGGISLADGTRITGTVSIANALTIGGTLQNTGSVALGGNVTYTGDITSLTNSGTVTYSYNNTDGYITSGEYYVVQSTADGSNATVQDGLKLNDTYDLVAKDGSIVINVENESGGGVFYLNTMSHTIDGTDTNISKDATGYVVAEGQTLTIAANQSDSMTSGKILGEATGKGNITLTTDATIANGVATQVEGTLTIEKATLQVGGGANNAANVSSFNAVTLKGGKLDLNGTDQTVHSLTVEEFEDTKSTLSVRNENARHKVYTLDGKTTLNADLDIATPDEHGDVIVNNLTGTGNLSISGGNAEWGATKVQLDKLTDYSGSIKVDNGGRGVPTYDHTHAYTHAVFGKADGNAAFTSLEGLEVVGNAYAVVHAKANSSITNLTLNNGMLKYGCDYGAYTQTLSNVDVEGTSTILVGSYAERAGSGYYEACVNIGQLTGGSETAATLVLESQFRNSKASVFNLNGGAIDDFSGVVELKATSTNNRNYALNIKDSDVAAGAEIKLTNTDTNAHTLALGIGAETVKVKALSGGGNAAVYSGAQAFQTTTFASDTTTSRTLEIATDANEYSATIDIKANVNLNKSGTGTQNISGDQSAMNGTLEASAGALNITNTGAAMSLAGVKATGGIVQVNDATNAVTVADMTVSGDGQVKGDSMTVTNSMTISKSGAFDLTGALVMTGATVDLSGFTLDTTTTQDTYVYTLGMAAGGITADESISFTGINVDGYTATLAAAAADPTASAVMLLDGAATNNYLVLTLTKDDDTPAAPALTTLNVTGVDVSSSSAGALTLTTAENATDAVFGNALNAVMDDATWADIKAALKGDNITLDDSIAVTFVGADGVTFDFDGENNTDTAPVVTINGEVTRDADLNAVGQTLTNNGTTVGNYVTAYIPEPTSTTLSLLALAALAVRRRRR
ncbi:MAG: hypothetical protein IJN29_08160 [Akkermansia sp.]|nr:hypothetical protein [Akkermansia sp.]